MNSLESALERKAKWVAATAWKRRWLGLAVALCVALVAALVISALSNRYLASARVFVDTQTVLKPLMAGITYQPDIDLQMRMLAGTLISRPNVERLLKVPGLGFDSLEGEAHEKTITALMEQIKIVPAGAGNLFEVSYRGSSPESARHVVESTVQMFVHTGAGAKKRDSEDAGRFIEEQIEAYEAKLIEAENRLKDFKLRNFGVSGVSNQDHFARLSALSDEVNRLRGELGAAEQARDAYRRELSGEEPQLAVERGSEAAVEIEERIETQRKQLDELLRRYTDEHPDVVNARRIIAQLEVEAQRRRDGAARRGMHTKAAATSPVYQRIRVALAEAEAQVASLRSQLATQNARLEQARGLAGRVPQVEAELVQLNRDYDVIRKNYESLVMRRESASLGVKLDQSSQLAEFRVVEPPRASNSPVFPSRLHLALIASVAALAIGVYGTVVVDILRPTFDSTSALRSAVGRPVLGNISVLATAAAKRTGHVEVTRFAISVAGVVALQAAWLVWVALRETAR